MQKKGFNLFDMLDEEVRNIGNWLEEFQCIICDKRCVKERTDTDELGVCHKCIKKFPIHCKSYSEQYGLPIPKLPIEGTEIL